MFNFFSSVDFGLVGANLDFIKGIIRKHNANPSNTKYFLVSNISLVLVKSLSIAPAEQEKKFQGAMPINTVKANLNREIFK